MGQVALEALATDSALDEWIRRGVTFAETLPAK
jgi:hypothetical protein